MKFDSIRWRLVLSYVLLTVLTVVLVGILTLTLLQQYVRAQTEFQLQANARAVAIQAAPLLVPVPRLNSLQDLASSLGFLGHVRVRILDSSYNVLVDSGLPESSTSVVWVQPDPAHQDRPPVIVPLSPRQQGRDASNAPWMRENFGQRPSVIMRIEEGPWGRRVVFEAISSQQQSGSLEANPMAAPTATQPRTPTKADASAMVTVRYPIGDAANPGAYVQLDSPASSGEQIMAAMRQALLLAGLVAALVAVAAGLMVGRSLTAPILALSASANRMSSGDLSARAPIGGAGEINRLARQFNTMAERLQASFAALSAERDALRRFVADASHELRTPVTALGNFIELLQGPAADDTAAREEFLAESQTQVKRMEWIMSNLLNLSRLDAGLVQLDCQPLDLADLLQSVAAPFAARAQADGIRLEVQLPADPIQVEVDRARMEMAIGNLIDNALKFTPDGGRVTLSGALQEGKVCIIVTDTGSGISAEDLPHIFERFYRGKTTREGSGLGLAIVQSILQAHSGEIRVESEPGQGSRFIFML